jgi:hypothetical protein
MVTGWAAANIQEPVHLSSALPPGVTGRYRIAVQAGAEPLEGVPGLDVVYRVVGLQPGSAGAFLASAVMRYGTILEVYASTTHTVVIVEEMDFLDGTLSRSTDPMIRLRMRERAVVIAPLLRPVVNAKLRSEVKNVVPS